ncbi:MAG: DUF1877 family protein [Pirellula sp.]
MWRQCYLDRRFDVLRYLLTESAPDEATGRLFELAINGIWQIHPDATATQGYPICWSDAATTKRIHAALGPIEFSSLAAHFGTANFLAAELYKKSLERREIHALHAYFCELKEYYRAAARANCGTLVLVD